MERTLRTHLLLSMRALFIIAHLLMTTQSKFVLGRFILGSALLSTWLNAQQANDLIQPHIELIKPPIHRDITPTANSPYIPHSHAHGAHLVDLSIKNAPISPLINTPNWAILSAFDYHFTQAELSQRLRMICANDSWKSWFKFDNNQLHVVNQTGLNYSTSVLKIRTQYTPALLGGRNFPYRYWRTTREIKKLDYNGNILPPVRVAIDPGHLGGEWADMEFRNFSKPGDAKIAEGDLVLLVAKKVKAKLEKLGAQAYLVRDSSKPRTSIRPKNLANQVKEYYPKFNIQLDERTQNLYQNQWFYQIAEIRERATIINKKIKPDLTLCLHLNAVEWGSDPENPVLQDQSHGHILLSGAATTGEMAKPDQRLDLLLRALQGIFSEEQKLGTLFAKSLEDKTKLAAFSYSSGGKNTLKVTGHPYLWARNLLANRIYTCPVIYYEPYVMNSVSDYPRLQHALKFKNSPHVYTLLDEYADAVVDGFIKNYAQSPVSSTSIAEPATTPANPLTP